MDNEQAWRAGLKAGDVAAVVFADGERMTGTATDASTTHVEAFGDWWSRHDGIGEHRITRMAGTRLSMPTPIEDSEYRARQAADAAFAAGREARRPDLVAAVQRFAGSDLSGVPIEVLERVAGQVPKESA